METEIKRNAPFKSGNFIRQLKLLLVRREGKPLLVGEFGDEIGDLHLKVVAHALALLRGLGDPLVGILRG